MLVAPSTHTKDPARGSRQRVDWKLYRRLRPGDLATVDNARQMIERMFFDFVVRLLTCRSQSLTNALAFEVANTPLKPRIQMSDLIAIISEPIRLKQHAKKLKTTLTRFQTAALLVVNWLLVSSALVAFCMQRNAMDRMEHERS